MALAALVMPAAVRAQQVDSAPSVERRMVVRQQPQGIRTGAFVIRPELTSLLTYDDNVFASPSDRRDDFVANLEARLRVNSDFRVHALSADAYVSRRQFFAFSSENVTDYGIGVGARYDVSSETSADLTGRFEHLAERRGSIDSLIGTIRPAQYDNAEAAMTVSHRFSRVGISATGRVRQLRYDPVRIGGVDQDQRFRDFTVMTGTLSAGYELSSAMAVLLRGEVERRRYAVRFGDADFDPNLVDRSADGFRLEAGISRQINDLISGTVRVGYLRYDYPDPRVPTISGFSYDADLRWDITRLTTVTLRARRRLDETVSPLTTGSLRDEVSVGVQHELLRSLLLTFDAARADIKLSGVLRDSREFQAELGARWYASRDLQFRASLFHRQRRTNSAAFDFSLNRVMIGVSIRR